MHIKHPLEIGVAVTGTAAQSSFATKAILRGVFALPGMTEKVTAKLIGRRPGGSPASKSVPTVSLSVDLLTSLNHLKSAFPVTADLS